MKDKSKYYWDLERNIDPNINPKMKLSKEELMKDNRVPDYYRGKNNYEARKVVDNFDLSYNIGNAVTYLLRAMNKHSEPFDCFKKAIAHIEFEIEKLKDVRDN
ncbi:MAG: hypothetical protein Unbinned176contig1000_36 [Prokaryotic dsDNA virus sp.]|nr:MAG: hypothetical protein Unbinned176contig1000_36 [Prokaryotic dsDNA virus sp.]|tara:strand:+ start:20544 stop:20852 length:309 start_codon:yes stop_codon:yes gene_type:complete